MIHECYGKDSLEISRYKYHKRRKKYIEMIEKIAQKNDVPFWKAQAYYYYSDQTSKFLYFREKRNERNYKNEVKRHFVGDLEKEETITPLNWKELYEILGKELTNTGVFPGILEAITKILSTIEYSVTKNEPIPYIYERVLPYQSVRYEYISIIDNNIKKYLLTELPKGSEIYIKSYIEEREEFEKKEYEYTMGGYGVITHDIYKTVKDLKISAKYSYSS